MSREPAWRRATACLAAAFVLAAGLPEARASSPSLGGLSPRGGQRGTTVEVTLSGGNLDDAKELLFYEPGIDVAKLEAVNNGTLKAVFSIAPDAALGAHRFRVRTATGLSDLRHFMVGALPTVAEVEPNDDFQNPQAVALNSTIEGVAQYEDVDYFAVEAKKGDRITAELEGIRLGVTFFDGYVAILNADRFELSSSDDHALLWQDGVASIVAPEDGRYVIQIRESSYQGNGACQYRVHVGRFPRPLAALPAGGKAGEPLHVRLLGDAAGDREMDAVLPDTGVDRFPLFAADEFGLAPSPVPLRVSPFGNVLEVEPNESHDQATAFTPPLALNGVIEKPGDVDSFRFTAAQGQVFDVRVYARGIRSPLDPVLYVSPFGGGVVAANDDSGGPDSYLRFQAPANGDYVVQIFDHLRNGGPSYAYRIELEPVAPKLELSLAEFVQYVQPTVSVPRGNRFAVMVNAARFDFGGPLSIQGLDLPAGVTIECPGMRADLSSVPVIFHAAADAPLAGALVDLVGKLDDPNHASPPTGRLKQDVVLVRGQNQIPVWTESVNRLATAVTEEAPFTVSIVPPQVPLVRDGQMNLKVFATRKEGFTAAIKVDLLWFPPGVNASRSIAIAEGQTEAIIPMNAAGNAPEADWPIAVTGQATVGNGPIMVSSGFASLKVAERYLTLAYDKAAVEQGKETEIVVKVNKLKEWAGEAPITLYGLPAHCETSALTVKADQQELVFKVKTKPEAPVGTHRNLFCQVVLTENGEPILHNLGTGELRIDAPLPPKKDEPPPPMPAPMPATAPEAPPMKRLTRLEQLRLEQQEREKKAKAAP